MKQTERYWQVLKTFNPDDWEMFLLKESGLPGRRANLELAHAVADEGNEAIFRRLLSWDPDQPPTNSPHEFLALCGTIGLGKLLAEGQLQVLEDLRLCASDSRWRIREGVAMALQRFGKVDMAALLQAMERWGEGSLLEKRAAVAGLCEPSLLYEQKHVERVLGILDRVTRAVCYVEERKGEEFRVLRKALGYCWSVAVVALPENGKMMMEQWFLSDDEDVIWIMRENLRKKRLVRMDEEWVERWKAQLGMVR